jgi:mannosyl-oligosaccharide alpha-1,2-mannosidase
MGRRQDFLDLLYVLTAGASKEILRRYIIMARDIRKRLLFVTIHRGLQGIGQVDENKLWPTMEHLVTFAGGMFALGSVKGNPKATADVALGDELARTCATVYREFKAGVGSEQVMYNTENEQAPEDSSVGRASKYLLRPKSVESVCLM